MRLARALLLASLFGTVSGFTQAAPGAPQLNAPPDGARLPEFRANLGWTNPAGTTQYFLEVVPFNNDGPGITLVRNVENSFIVQPPRMGFGNYVLLPDMTYTWRVSASDNPGFAPPGDASYGPVAQRTFRAPAVTSGGIGPVAPADGGNADGLTPTLQWQNSDNRVFYYEVQISKDPGFGPNAFLYWELIHGGVSSPVNSYRVPDAFPREPNARYYDGGGGGDPFRNGQSLGTLLGKILRIDVRGAPPEGYRIPPDNPFIGVPGAQAEIWAYGMRNPWRFSFDRANGRMWTGDVGQNAFEEIDLIEKGKNYGWNVMEGSHCYSPASGCNTSGLEMPVIDYGRDEGCSVTGGFVYRGNAIPSLRGVYVYADFCSGTVWGLWHDGSSVVRHEVLLEAGDEINISSFAEDLAGELYVLSWNQGIYRLDRSKNSL